MTPENALRRCFHTTSVASSHSANGGVRLLPPRPAIRVDWVPWRLAKRCIHAERHGLDAD